MSAFTKKSDEWEQQFIDVAPRRMTRIDTNASFMVYFLICVFEIDFRLQLETQGTS
jgi:hypothetical protein